MASIGDDRGPHYQRVIGRNVRLARIERGWTLVELARGAQLTRSFLGEIEAGKRNPSAVVLIRLAETLRVSLDYLARGARAEDTEESIPPSLAKAAAAADWPYSDALHLAALQEIIETFRRVDEFQGPDWRRLYRMAQW